MDFKTDYTSKQLADRAIGADKAKAMNTAGLKITKVFYYLFFKSNLFWVKTRLANREQEVLKEKNITELTEFCKDLMGKNRNEAVAASVPQLETLLFPIIANKEKIDNGQAEINRIAIERYLQDIKQVHTAIINPNIQNWLQQAAKDPLLSGTELYRDLKELSDRFRDKDQIPNISRADMDRLLLNFRRYQDQINQISQELAINLPEVINAKKQYEVIDQLIEVGSNANIAEWLIAAEKDSKLQRISLYSGLKKVTEQFRDNKQDIIARFSTRVGELDEIIRFFEANQAEINRILVAKNNQLIELMSEQKARYVDRETFEKLRRNEQGVVGIVRDLIARREGHLWKQNFGKLLQILTPQLPAERVDANAEVGDRAAIAPRVFTVSYDAFEKEINKLENAGAKEAFEALEKILRGENVTAEVMRERIEEYINNYESAEQFVNDLIGKLQEPLKAISSGTFERFDLFNGLFEGLENHLKDRPALQNKLMENTRLSLAYVMAKQKLRAPRLEPLQKQQLQEALSNMKNYLGATKKEQVRFVIGLGNAVLEKPGEVFGKYLELTPAGPVFTDNPSADNTGISRFLVELEGSFDKKTYNGEELIRIEAFTISALYGYVANPKNSLDGSFPVIIESLKKIRAKAQAKMNQAPIRETVDGLRKEAPYQAFLKTAKAKIENTPNYPKDFWINQKMAKKLQIAEPILAMIGSKIASPDQPPRPPARLLHQNKILGYDIYLYPGSEEKGEKPKLLIFLNKEIKYAIMQGMDHQLGLYGDQTILGHASEVLSDITQSEILTGLDDHLKAGNLEIVASGFGNSGAAAAMVANRIAVIYPRTEVVSISAGSTAVVSTEEAYNMNQADNFLAVRLKYEKDSQINRVGAQVLGDFSDDTYTTFPIIVRHKSTNIDWTGHYSEEYGNIENFLPAMTGPVVLRGLYDEIAGQVVYEEPQRDRVEVDLSRSLTNSLMASIVPIARPILIKVGRIDDLIDLGERILHEPGNYDGTFLRLDGEQLRTEDDTKLIQQLQDEQAQALEADAANLQKSKGQVKKAESSWFSWFSSPSQEAKPNAATDTALSYSEQEKTVLALQQTLDQLKKPEVTNLVGPKEAFALLIAANTLLINYTKVNSNIGKIPQLVDLISELRELASTRLSTLYRDLGTTDEVSKLFRDNQKQLAILQERILVLTPSNRDLFGSDDILGKIDFEDRFLEYLGFKIALKGTEKIGSKSYVTQLHNDASNKFDISLYTPDASQKKQRIVITCNGEDVLGSHNLVGGLGAGDTGILKRAELLQRKVSEQLEEQFQKNGIGPADVEIVVTGFGSEGAVATALGYLLADQYASGGGEVRSVGFGAPKFGTIDLGNRIRGQKNFVPIRLLSPTDTRFEWKAVPAGDYTLSDSTYYTIPLQFRIVGALELGGHNTNLYGDVQGIRTAMKSAYQMREVAREGKRLKPAKETAPPPVAAKRVIIDPRKTQLVDLNKMPVENLKREQPGKLINIMKFCVELGESDSITKEEKGQIKAFMDKFIEAIKNSDINESHPIGNAFCQKMFDCGYNPRALFGGKWRFQRMISTEVDQAMTAVETAGGNLSEKERSELILKRSYARGVLAGNLNGNRYKPAGGGVNGAVFFRHLESGSNVALEGEAGLPFLGVFKPHPETVREFKGWFDATQWGERLKAVVGMDAHLNKKDPNNRVHNEIFAYELFNIFGFGAKNRDFPTTLKFENPNDAQRRPASFCAFIPGLDIVGSHIRSVTGKDAKSNTLDDNRVFSPEELTLWQMSKIFDFLTGNLDGHEGNAFVKVEGGKVVGTVNFDYDKAFTVDNPGNIGNQYKWAHLEISKGAFTPETKRLLTEMFGVDGGEAKIAEFVAKARTDAGENGFTEAQVKLLKRRVAVLRLVARGDIQRLSTLRDYVRGNELKKAEKKLQPPRPS